MIATFPKRPGPRSRSEINRVRISELAMSGNVILEECQTIDSIEVREQAEWLQLATDLEGIAARMRKLAVREVERDVMYENVRHDKARQLFKQIASLNEGLGGGDGPDAA